MGWWKVEQNEVGDTTLDIVRKFIVDFSQEYQEDLGRKPTLDELQYSLQLAFKVNLNDEILTDFEDLEIKQVMLKSAKRPKRQKAKVGDFFAFKVTPEIYCFGRLVTKVSLGFVAEIFNYFSKQPILNPLYKEWLILPVVVNSLALFENRSYGLDFSDWRILDDVPDTQVSSKFDNIFFKYGHVGDYTVINVSGEKVSNFRGDISKVQNYTVGNDVAIIELIKPFLSKTV